MNRSAYRRKLAIAGIAIAVAAVISFYLLVAPDSGFYPRCVFRELTALSCPGCGSQRMIFALLHGNIAEAFSANPFLFVFIPVLGFLILAELFRTRIPRLYKGVNRPSVIVGIGMSVILWWILRNIFGL